MIPIAAREAEAPEAADHSYRPHLPIIGAMVLTQFAASSGLVTIYVMLNSLYREYPGQEIGVGWVVTSYLAVSAITGAICGRQGDLIGRRKMTLIVLLVAGAGSVVSALSKSLWVLIAGAALQGFASSLTPLLVAMARDYMPRHMAPVIVGVITAAGTAGAGVVYLLAGVVIDHFSSHGGFLLKTSLAILAFVVVALVIPTSPRTAPTSHPVRIVRGALFGPAIAGLLIGVQFGSIWGWGDPRTLGLICGSLLLLAYWARDQWRDPAPLIELRLLFRGRLLKANIAMLLLGLGCVQQGQMINLVLQQRHIAGGGFALSASATGLLMMLITGVAVVVSPISGRIAAKWGARLAGLIGAGFALVAWTLFALFHDDFHLFMTAAMLSSIGFSLLFPAGFILLVDAAPAESVSGATGLGYTLFQLGLTVGSRMLFGWMALDTIKGPDGVIYPTHVGLSLAFADVAVLTAPLLLVFLSIKANRPA